MPDEDSYRRYLIAVGITKDLPKTGPSIVESVNRMARVFTGDFGYERVTQLDIDPASDQIEKEIREFCLKRGPDDIVTLYYTGHADEVDGTHRVWTGNTLDRFTGNLETRQLARLMLRDTPLRYALIILDTCLATQGEAAALLASMPSMGDADGKTVAVIAAANTREQIVAGDFARLFEQVVNQPAVAGNGQSFLGLGTIARLINTDPSRPGWQTVTHGFLSATNEAELLPFLPNRRFSPPLHGLDWLTQLQLEQKLRAGDLKEHFLPRARGVAVPTEPGWRFVGRETALRDLVSWLNNPDEQSARVVTGGPGSGKSAVIGRLVVLSDSSWRRTVPVADLPADTVPPEGSIATGIHARGLTNKEVLTAVCAAAGVKADTPADLLREMRDRRLTVAIDAIDEALDPAGLVTTILVPLVEAGPARGLCLLLGTRPHLLESLGMADRAIDLDHERYADPESIFLYVLRGLETDNPQSPYHAVSEELAAGVARAVAEAAGHSFLVARIVSRTLLSRDPVPDPTDPSWKANLPGDAAAAMHDDLETRLGADADRARDLLRPLAFAFGAGLLWENLWAPLSSELSGRDYTDEDLVWLRRQAGSYVVEATMESGHSVYRLYHAALAEYLRQGCDEGHIHAVFSAFLIDRVPRSRPGQDWSRADPYTLAHLASHAQRAGVLDDLLTDPRYLVNAVPAELVAALPAARDPDAELAGRAYQRAVHQFRGQPESDRLSYLELASRITHAAALIDRIAAVAPRRPWSVPWTHWPPEHPHRILDGHLGPISGVICAKPGEGNPVVVSIGQDANLRIWDAVTAEPGGTYAVGDAPLVAISPARLSEHRTVIVLLAANGMLYVWDMSTAALARTIPLASRWRRLSWLRAADLNLRCAGARDGKQFAIAGGRGMRTSIWELPSGRRVAVLPAGASPGSIEFTELIDGRTVITTGSWVGDLQTGQQIPYEPQRIPFAWLRPLYDRVVRTSELGYFKLRDGPPVIAVRLSRETATVWDLTVGYPLGTWPRGESGIQVQLTDGRTVTVPVPLPPTRRAGSRLLLQEQAAPAEGPDHLVPLIGGWNPFDHEPREPLSVRLQASDRFLRVAFRDDVEQPDRGAVSLTLAGHTADVTGSDWARLPDGHVIVVTGSQDGTVRRWDISSIRPEVSDADEQPRVALHRVLSVPLDDGRPLGLTTADDPNVALWDLRTGEFLGELGNREIRPCAVAVARPAGRGPIAVTFDVRRAMRIWSLPDGSQIDARIADPARWPSDAACTLLPDGACVAVTSGHARRTVVWDLATGRIRHVLGGHRGWSACVTCTGGTGPRALALTGGLDNRVNVWDLRRGKRRGRFRIVPPWARLLRPSAGQVHAVRVLPPDGGKMLVLVATADGLVRGLEPYRFLRGARRAGAVSAQAVETATLSTGRAVVLTATHDGVVQVWKREAFTRRGDAPPPLCEINLEAPVNDMTIVDRDTFVFATPNGLTAVRLDAGLLENYVDIANLPT